MGQNSTTEDRGAGTTRSRSPRREVRMEFAAASDAGRVRGNNEDHYAVARIGRSFRLLDANLPAGDLPEQVDEVAYGMVVADGMGGMAAGDRASRLAIRTGVGLVLDSPRWATRIDEEEARLLIERLHDYFRQVDRAVIGEGRAEAQLQGMGTTLTLAYSVGVDLFIVHVGDSRAYLYRRGRLEQLTSDHTMARKLAEVGEIHPDEVHRHASRHLLTNYVGGPNLGVEPEVVTLALEDGDRLLLCSDGLTEMVADAEIARILGDSATPDDAARSLVRRANEQGGRDNITVIVARFEVA